MLQQSKIWEIDSNDNTQTVPLKLFEVYGLSIQVSDTIDSTYEVQVSLDGINYIKMDTNKTIVTVGEPIIINLVELNFLTVRLKSTNDLSTASIQYFRKERP